MAKVGLDNVVVAKITTDENGVDTYGTPVRIANVMDASMTPNVDSQQIFGDDKVSEIINVFSSVEVSFTFNDIGSENYALLLGKEVDENGVVIDDASDESPYFALGFRSKLSNNKGYRYYWLYKGRFQTMEESFATQADSADSQNQPISGTFIKRADGKIRVRVDSTDKNINQAVLDNWFNAPYEKQTP